MKTTMAAVAVALVFMVGSVVGQQKLVQIREQMLLRDRHRVWSGQTYDLLPIIRESAKSFEFVEKDGWHLVRGRVETSGAELTIKANIKPNGPDNTQDTFPAKLKNYPRPVQVGEIVYCLARQIEKGSYDFGGVPVR